MMMTITTIINSADIHGSRWSGTARETDSLMQP